MTGHVTHGLGPHITHVNGQASTPRQDLKEVYSTIEEAKADITGLYSLRYMMEQGQLKGSLGQGEAADVEHPAHARRQEVDDARAAGWIARGGDNAGGFVHCEILKARARSRSATW